MITREELLRFLRLHRYAVQGSAGTAGGVQAAVVGIAVDDDFTIVFDTLETSRKAENLAKDPRIALVIGGTGNTDDRTVQYEGVVERPQGRDLEAARARYFLTFPDGRERLNWAGIVHLRVRPTWLRYSDFRTAPPIVVEMSASQLAALA